MTFFKTHSELKYKSEDTVSQSRSPWSLRQNSLREGELMLTDGINNILKEKTKSRWDNLLDNLRYFAGLAINILFSILRCSHYTHLEKK